MGYSEYFLLSPSPEEEEVEEEEKQLRGRFFGEFVARCAQGENPKEVLDEIQDEHKDIDMYTLLKPATDRYFTL